MADALRPYSSTVFENGREGYPAYRIPSVAALPDGTLVAICEGRGLQKGTHGDITGNHLVCKRSEDGGRTWSSLSVIASEPGNSLLGPCAVVTSSGRLVLVYHRYLPGTTEHNASEGISGPRVVDVLFSNPADKGKRIRGTIRISFDDGATWPMNKVIEAGAFGYSCLVPVDRNHVGCLYEGAGGRIEFKGMSLAWLSDGTDTGDRDGSLE